MLSEDFFDIVFINLSLCLQESQLRLSKRLLKIGFDIDQGSIFSSLSAARSVIEKRKLNPYYILEDVALEVLY